MAIAIVLHNRLTAKGTVRKRQPVDSYRRALIKDKVNYHEHVVKYQWCSFILNPNYGWSGAYKIGMPEPDDIVSVFTWQNIK